MFKTFINIVRETILLISELPYLRYINASKGHPEPEYGTEDKVISDKINHASKVKLVASMVARGESTAKTLDRFFVKPHHYSRSITINEFNEQETLCYFINGIMTTKDVLDVNLDGLSRLLDEPVMGLYNPSRGMYRDLIESVVGRATSRLTPIARIMAQHLFYPVLSGKKIHIIAHSQGGIILSNVVKILKGYGLDLSNIELFTIAGAQDEFPLVKNVEHFGNEKDYVFRIGAKHYQTRIAGIQYTANLPGHLLNSHYLTNLKQGKYCNGESRLYQIIERKKES